MPHPSDDLILVFDAGTQSVRCGLFDVAGGMADFIKLPIQLDPPAPARRVGAHPQVRAAVRVLPLPGPAVAGGRLPAYAADQRAQAGAVRDEHGDGQDPDDHILDMVETGDNSRQVRERLRQRQAELGTAEMERDALAA